MNEAKDGGPAHPCSIFTTPRSPAVKDCYGLTIRDYFAIRILAASLTARGSDAHEPSSVVNAYRIADMMLVERSKQT